MAEIFRNYIAGEWVAGTSATANRNPSDTSDVIGEYAQADAEQTRTAIAAAKKAFPAWATGSIQERANILDRAGNEILARKDELGRLLSREEGKTLPEGIGEAVRAGQIFKFFAGEALRLSGEKVAVGAARRRRGGDARAGRRRRPHHAVEFSDRDPGVEDRARARLRQHRRDQAGRSGARAARGRSPKSSRAPGCRPACSTWSWGAAPSWAKPSSTIPTSPAISFTGSVETGRGIAAKAYCAHGQVPARNGRQESAGRAR